MLHIGDSEEADERAPRAYGINTYRIKSPADMWELTLAASRLEALEHTPLLKGLVCARLFQSPFALHDSGGRLPLTRPFSFGYTVLAPILLGVVRWLVQALEEAEIDIILFLARDGYLIKKVYDRLKDHPTSEYLLASRTICTLAALETEEELKSVMSLPFSGTAEELLRQRFQLTEEELSGGGSTEERCSLILKKAAETRTRYRSFLKSYQTDGKRLGIFDFSSAGTCQMYLEKLLGSSMQGFYFERIVGADIRRSALSVTDFVHAMAADAAGWNYFYLEPLIKEPVPSLKNIAPDGSPVFCPDRMSAEQKRYVLEAQKGALSIIDEYLELTQGRLEEGLPGAAVEMLRCLDETYIDAGSFELENFDEFTNRLIRLKL